MTKDGSGLSLSAPFAVFGPDGSLQRTSRDSSLFQAEMDSAPCSPRWPRWGTMRSGRCFQLPPLERLTDGNGSGLWHTPVANDDNKTPAAHLAMKARMKGGPRYQITSLQVEVQLWRTPRSMDGKGGLTPDSNSNRAEVDHYLPDQVNFALWPTPRSSPNENRSTQQTPSQIAGTHGKYLATEVLWPTPQASDGEKGGPNMRHGSGDQPLPGQAAALWKTPTAEDCQNRAFARNSRGEPKLSAQVNPALASSAPSPAATTGEMPSWYGTGQLAPTFVEWLMGFPAGWLDWNSSEVV